MEHPNIRLSAPSLRKYGSNASVSGGGGAAAEVGVVVWLVSACGTKVSR